MTRLRKWTYSDEERKAMEDIECYDCGLPYGSDAWCDVVVSNEVWELINPTNHKHGGLLCFNCTCRRIVFIGLKDVKIRGIYGPAFFLEPEKNNGKT